MLAAIKAYVGGSIMRCCCRSTSSEPLLVLALQQPTELLRDSGRYGNFRSADFKQVMTFYRNMFEQDGRRGK